MALHKCDKELRSDDEFIQGELAFIVAGNKCRLLDGRRTEGFIEEYSSETTMFRWRITKYEDKGSFWDLPAEKIKGFQFEKDSKKLSQDQVNALELKIKELDQPLVIKPQESDKVQTELEIKTVKETIKAWLIKKSLFFRDKEALDFNRKEGYKSLASDLMHYMESVDLAEEEKRTAEKVVLNPNSGEWVKGMSIILGEMGLAIYDGKIPRTKDIFQGRGSKDNRRKYIIHRLAFLRAFFELNEVQELVLFRGMSSEGDWEEIKRTYISYSFSLDVANEFSSLLRDSKYRSAYVMKSTCSIDKILMTYLETEAMNQQYKEAEALVLCEGSIQL